MFGMTILHLAIIADEIQEPETCVHVCPGTCDTGCVPGSGHWRP